METIVFALIWAIPLIFIALIIDQIWGTRSVALRELAKIYARGEISDEEFDRRRTVLKRIPR